MGQEMRDVRHCSTLTRVLRERAQQNPEKVGFVFLRDGEEREEPITFAELESSSRAVAATLTEQGLRPGDRALILLDSSLEFITSFFGCLHAGVVAVPLYEPNPHQPPGRLARMRAIVDDSSPAIALCTRQLADAADSFLSADPRLASLRLLPTDEIDVAAADSWQDPGMQAEALCFLQYTSGSTAAPKGVMVSHGNLMHNSGMLRLGLDQGPETTYMSWLPLFHDLGLIGTMLQTVQVGTRCVFMAPMSFLRKPVRWLRAVTRHRAAISGGPNFAFDLCLRKVSEEMMEQLDLSQWSRAFCGAEPVRAETLQRFTRRFDACGFQASAWWPCYGLAEATLFVSGSRVVAEPLVVHVRKDALEKGRIALEPESGPETRSLVACGHAWPGWDVAIIDPATRCRCGSDEVGEIWLRGPSSAGAYWRRPEISRETFEATIEPDEEGPYLRTGDLGFVSQGELVITGRIKDLIIMNGQNHYPHDIELTVERCHQAFRPGGSAAFSVDDGQAERLVVVTEVDRRYRPPGGSADGTDCPILDPALARGAVRSAVVAGHDLFVHELVLIRAGALPKTSSGKVQRRATQAAFLEGSLSLWDA